MTAAQALGIAQGSLDLALEYINQRQQFNRKLSVFQITRHKIAQMATKIETARLITYKAAHLFDRGKKDAGLISMAKMTASRAAVEVAELVFGNPMAHKGTSSATLSWERLKQERQ